MSSCNDIERDMTSGVECRVGANFEHGGTLAFQLSIEVGMDPLANSLQTENDDTDS